MTVRKVGNSKGLAFRLAAAAALLLLPLLAPPSVLAVAKAWDAGGGNTNWYNPANWSPDGVPTSADDVTIDVNGANVVVNASSPSISFTSLTLGNTGGTNTVSLTLSTTIASGGNVTVNGAGTLISDTTHQLTITGNLTVKSAGTVTHNSNTTTLAKALNLRVTGNLDLQSGGSIHGNAKGYTAGGPGVGGNGGTSTSGYGNYYNGGGGAGHGASGGAASGGPGAAGGPYDSFTLPVNAGSRGGNTGSGVSGGAGGGLLKLSVGGAATINGTLSANGANGTNNTGVNGGSGGGSGGSVHLVANTMGGGGVISVIGGTGGSGYGGSYSALSYGGGGAGGYIRLDVAGYNYGDFTGAMAFGGAAGGGGGAGTGGSGRVEPSTATLSNNAGGQRGNSIGPGALTGVNVFGFNINPYLWAMRVSSMTFNLTSVTGVANGDWANVKILQDANGNGRIDAGETTQVGGAGSVDTAGGKIVFSSSFTVAAGGANYILAADLSNLAGGDTFTLGLAVSSITLVSTSSPSNLAVRFTGSATGVTHTVQTSIAWDGGAGDLNWNTPDNWNPNVVPTDLADVAINMTAAVTARIGQAAIKFNTLTMGNAAGTTSPSLTISTTILNGGNVLLDRNASLTALSALNIDGTVTLNQSAALTYSSASVITGDVILNATGATLTSDTTQQLAIGGGLTVKSGAVLTHNVNAAVLARGLNISVGGNLDLQSGGAIHGNAKGFSSGGAGAGTAGSYSSSGYGNYYHGGGGGGHGGAGGAGAGGAAGGAAHDSFNLPAAPGGKGGNSNAVSGGYGGGFVKLNVSGLATINGTLSANGGAGGAASGASGGGGGGAGGSVYLIANTMSGAGVITALGGNGGGGYGGSYSASSYGGGGGGGYVRLDAASYNYNDFSGALSILSGASGGGGAGAGAIGRVEPSTATLSNNAGGQRTNSMGVGNLTSVNLFGFRLNPYQWDMQVNSIVFSLSAVTGIVDGEWTNVRIYEDTNGNGRIDVGENTQVGGAGVVNTAGGTITFSTPFTVVAAGRNYVLLADIANVTGGDSLTLNLNMSNVTIVSATNTTKKAIKFSGTVSGATHTASTVIVWTGLGYDLNWNTPDNWDPKMVPVAQSDVTINMSSSVVARINQPAVKFNTLTLGNAAGTTSPTLSISTTILNSGDVLIDRNATLIASGTLTINGNVTLNQSARLVYSSASVITGNLSLNATGATLTSNTTQQLSITGNMTAVSGAVVTHNTNSGTTMDRSLNISVGGSLNLQSGASMNADAKGFSAAGSPGAGGNGSSSSSGYGTYYHGGGGGGHYGTGGAGSGGAAGGAAHDAFNSPAASGGKGGNSGAGVAGGNGGGFIKLNVSGLATINGTLSANGAAGTNSAGVNGGSGGGAGGAVHLVANTMSGAGVITALGGNGGGGYGGSYSAYSYAGGGAGGMIRLNINTYDYNNFSGGLSILNGASGGGGAGAGAIGRVEPSTGTLSNNAGGQRPNSIAFGDLTNVNLFGFRLNPYQWDMQVNSIVFTLSAVTGIVDGDWTNVKLLEDTNGNGRIDAGETTQVGGAGAVNTAGGTITFSTPFTVVAAGKNYVLMADIANVVIGDTLTLGLTYPNVTLVSATNTTKKAIKFTGTVSNAVHTASSVIVWTGNAGDLSWHTPDNWNPAMVPVSQSDVTIDKSSSVVARINGAAIKFNTLTLGNAAGTTSPTLSISTTILNSGDVLIDRNATLIASGTLTINGNVTLNQSARLVYSSASVITGNLSLNATGATLTSNTTEQLTITGNMTAVSGAVVTHNVNSGTVMSRSLNISVGGSLNLQSGASMNVDAKGFSAAGSPGTGGNGSSSTSGYGTYYHGGGGGGHHGAGGAGGGGAAAGPSHDSFNSPAAHGGKGGTSGAGVAGGNGGGFIKLNVSGLATISGTLSANGGAGTNSTGANGAGGGGAGGAVHLVANTMNGGGVISVLGGSGGVGYAGSYSSYSYGGGGAGGMIRLNVNSYDYNDFSGGLLIFNGASGGGGAAAGSLGRIEASTATLRNNTGGQRTNSFSIGDMAGVNLLGFNIEPYQWAMRVTSLAISLSAVSGIVDGDWANLKLLEDTNSNGRIDAGETTQVGGAGVVNTGAGTITFSSSFDPPAGGRNYILVGDVADLANGDTVTVGLNTANIVIVSTTNTTQKAIKLISYVTNVTHTADSAIYWDGGAGDSNWNSADNWNPNAVPVRQNDVTIDRNVSVQAKIGQAAIKFNSLTLGDPAGTYSPSLTISTTIVNSGHVLIDRNATLIASGTLTVNGNITLNQSAKMVYSSASVVTGDIILNATGATLTSNTSQQLTIGGALTVKSGAVMTHNVNLATTSISLNLNVGSFFDLQSGGSINVDGKGFSTGGSGAGTAGSAASSWGVTYYYGGGGGGYGGAGGAGSGGQAGGAVFGSRMAPVDAGGKGGNSGGGRAGGAGGGYVRLTVGTLATINGTLSMNGSAGTASSGVLGGGGGGAGGALYLTANTLNGGGVISAVGGNGGNGYGGSYSGYSYGGGGGGGRLAFQVINSGSLCSMTLNYTGGTKGGGTAGNGATGTLSSTATIVSPVSFTGIPVSSTAISWSWDLVIGAQNYRVYSSTGGNGQSPSLSASTTFFVETNLLPNTTYMRYLTASDCQKSSSTIVISAATLARPLAGSKFLSVDVSSITAGWVQLPAGPPSSVTASGYILQASTASDFTGQIFYSSTTALASSTLTVTGLMYDTTYYLRSGSLNWVDRANYTVIGSTMTGFYDCGFRVNEPSGTAVIGCEPPGMVLSVLRIFISGAVFGIPTVDLIHPKASKVRVMTPSGVKALPKIR